LNPTAGAIPGRDGIYDYLHYHSRIHEVLGIARGSAIVRLGGNKGRIVKLKAGDAVVLPAGTGHQCLSARKTFMTVGAYPPSGTYDECGPTAEEHERNAKAVRKVGRPRKDPLFGSDGPLLKAWKPKKARTSRRSRLPAWSRTRKPAISRTRKPAIDTQAAWKARLDAISGSRQPAGAL
jgi:uncharacterized protein YjlB